MCLDVPAVELESAVMAASGPSVQVGLTVRSLSSVLEVKELNAGREAVGLNKPLFLPPCKTPACWPSLECCTKFKVNLTKKSVFQME